MPGTGSLGRGTHGENEKTRNPARRGPDISCPMESVGHGNSIHICDLSQWLREGDVRSVLMRDNRPYDLKRRSDQDGSDAKQTKVVVLHLESFCAFIYRLDF